MSFESLKEAANDAFAREDFMEACNTYSLLLVQEPRSVALYNNRSAALTRLGWLELAIDDARKALEFSESEGQRVKARYRLASALHANGQHDTARRELAAAIEQQPSSAQLQSLMGRIDQALEQSSAATAASSSTSSGGMRITMSRGRGGGKTSASSQPACTEHNEQPATVDATSSAPLRPMSVLSWWDHATAHIQAALSAITGFIVDWISNPFRALTRAHPPAAPVTIEPPSPLASLPPDLLGMCLAPLHTMELVHLKRVCHAWAAESRSILHQRAPSSRLFNGTYVFSCTWLDAPAGAIWPESDAVEFRASGTLTLTSNAVLVRPSGETLNGGEARGQYVTVQPTNDPGHSTAPERKVFGRWISDGRLELDWFDAERQARELQRTWKLRLERCHVSAERQTWNLTGESVRDGYEAMRLADSGVLVQPMSQSAVGAGADADRIGLVRMELELLYEGDLQLPKSH